MAPRRGGLAAAAAKAVAVMALVYYFTLFVVLDHWLGLATPAGAAHAAAISLANRVLRRLRVRCSC
jgi:palmitoyltransferase